VKSVVSIPGSVRQVLPESLGLKGGTAMKRTEVSFPELGLIAATRGLLGAGVGFLLADFLSGERRKAVGWTLFGVGALSTIPLAMLVLGRRHCEEGAEERDVERRARSESIHNGRRKRPRQVV
jgi:hypothetical protein